MTKRRLDDSSFANVLRQKVKEDPVIKQQAAQNTFALLMKAQQRPKPRAVAAPSYKYFNAPQEPAPVEKCQRCANASVYNKCSFCEHILCHNCLQDCGACQYLFCSTCSVIDYSMSTDQVFCVSCTQNR
ncbi:hypothetical protein BDF21DRAFT_448359 [Thamnidium elegans]|nr:hypothetical protein BDF21DRAFT_448359 [Thamnidium elegans]